MSASFNGTSSCFSKYFENSAFVPRRKTSSISAETSCNGWDGADPYSGNFGSGVVWVMKNGWWATGRTGRKSSSNSVIEDPGFGKSTWDVKIGRLTGGGVENWENGP